ncbi:hypothetical protein L3X38_016612 [Prunus dulcis]|uniref:Uncharacterized protein n=2 Tax=Prunus dulcis TaxID=3755 RepID=A0AAD4Z9A3_PRUDU|nr:hypothetical protein L3X38_016612 [Prunus dulcis]
MTPPSLPHPTPPLAPSHSLPPQAPLPPPPYPPPPHPPPPTIITTTTTTTSKTYTSTTTSITNTTTTTMRSLPQPPPPPQLPFPPQPLQQPPTPPSSPPPPLHHHHYHHMISAANNIQRGNQQKLGLLNKRKEDNSSHAAALGSNWRTPSYKNLISENCTQGRRSRKLELIPIDQELERTIRKHRMENFSPRPTMANLVNNGGDNPPLQPRILRDYTAPAENNAPSCIVLTPITQRFEIRPTTIQLIPSFHGKEENPYHHLKTFFTTCSTFNYGDVSEEQIQHFL